MPTRNIAVILLHCFCHNHEKMLINQPIQAGGATSMTGWQIKGAAQCRAFYNNISIDV